MLTIRLAAFFLIVPMTALVAQSEWGASLVIDMFQSKSVREELKEDNEIRANLEVINTEIQRRIAIKEALIAELIAGRTTLAKVTDQFLVMNQSRPEYMTIIRSSCPGNSDFEKTAHNVIGYANGELSRLPESQQAEIRARLQAELQCLSGTHTAVTN
ncbi:MAG: hypothetical protein C0467_20720 [Planctomycetaceae bacterium]|nr:hypothetical protein [Planctomycetaceae bacterium]